MKALVFALALCMLSCTTEPQIVEETTVELPVADLPEPEPEPDRCPPLPLIRENATRFETRLWTLSVIALYAQCANSKKDHK